MSYVAKCWGCPLAPRWLAAGGTPLGPVLSPCHQGDKVLGEADSVRAVEGE